MNKKDKLLNIYQNANIFRQCALRSLGINESDDKIKIISNDKILILKAPTIVNIAFACELYLKAILFNQGAGIPETHELNFLYNQVSQQKRAQIRKTCNKKKEEFEQLIAEYSKLFIQYRYSFNYEDKPNPRIKFLLDLTDTLQEICKQITESQ